MSKLRCDCGRNGVWAGTHIMGAGGCNYVIAEGDFIPHNKRLENTAYGPIELWDVGIQTVTEIRLFGELMYRQHKNGVWSYDKTKQPEIINK